MKTAFDGSFPDRPWVNPVQMPKLQANTTLAKNIIDGLFVLSSPREVLSPE
jgi:hypothetical protein